VKTETVLILLPVEYNPTKKGKRAHIPIKSFQDAAIEIAELFKLGCTLDPYPKHGIWIESGIVYEDVNVILEINNFPKSKEKQIIDYCQDKLLARFKQEAVLIKFIPVQAMIVSRKKIVKQK
jgi:hypothetical protein